MTPTEAFEQFQTKQLTGSELMRHVVSHDQYLLPGSIDHDPLHAYFETDEGIAFHIFENSETFVEWQEKWEVEPLFVGPLTGREIVRALATDVDFLNINPDSARGAQFHYRTPHIAALKKLGAAIEIERILHEPTRAEEMFGLLQSFPHFQVLYRSSGSSEMQLVMAPDSQDRRLIPIFTAADSFALFLDRAKPEIEAQGGVPHVTTRTGEELFAELAECHADGIVFNPVGYAKPKAFAMKFCKVIRDYENLSEKNRPDE